MMLTVLTQTLPFISDNRRWNQVLSPISSFLRSSLTVVTQTPPFVRRNEMETSAADISKFRREDFQSTSEWVDAIRKEVATVLLPAATRLYDYAEISIAQDAAFFTQEVVKDELAVDERIDAMIDRAVVQAKAMKQMLGTTSSHGGKDQSKLQANKSDGSARKNGAKQSRRSDSTRST
jgi:hypothetical protein